MSRCLDAIQLKDQRSYVLFLTSMRALSAQCSRVLIDRGCLVLPLEQSLVFDEEGWLLPMGSQADTRVQKLVIAEAASSGWKISNATWLYVEGSRDSFPGFAHCDGDRWCKHERLLFTQMGLANAKNGLPNMQWELLYSLAQGHGLLTWNSPGARRENRKHREALNKTLRAFFGIDGDPIGLTDDKKGYRCAFKLVPDNSLEYARLAA